MSGDTTQEELPQSPRLGRQQLVGTIVTLVLLVVVFAGIIPQLGDYSQAWAAIAEMSTASSVALLGSLVVMLVAYVWPFQAALVGLGFWDGFAVRNVAFAISNSIPAGGPIGIATQYSMLVRRGFGVVPTTGALGITSVWNSLLTIALPVAAAAGLVITGDATGPATTLAIVGSLVLVVVVGLLVVVLRSEAVARRVGGWGDALVAWAARLVRRPVDVSVSDAVLEFRSSVLDVVSRRWGLVTGTSLLQQITQFLILWVALIGVGNGSASVSLLQAFAAFAIGRLFTFTPVVPGGLGAVDAAMVAILQGFGEPDNDALAAVMVWRAVSLFPQVLIGAAMLLRERRAGHRTAAVPGP
ncbi:MAG: flippase-like domain-containing protein [Jiangellales bacterium]